MEINIKINIKAKLRTEKKILLNFINFLKQLFLFLFFIYNIKKLF